MAINLRLAKEIRIFAAGNVKVLNMNGRRLVSVKFVGRFLSEIESSRFFAIRSVQVIMWAPCFRVRKYGTVLGVVK